MQLAVLFLLQVIVACPRSRVTGLGCVPGRVRSDVKSLSIDCAPCKPVASQVPPMDGRSAMHALIFSLALVPGYCTAKRTIGRLCCAEAARNAIDIGKNRTAMP